MPSAGPSPARRAEVYARDLLRCRYCGRDVVEGGAGLRRATVDHVVPIVRFRTVNGGPGRGQANTLENLVTACYLCNSTKADRTPDEAGMSLLPRPDGRPAPVPKVPKVPKAKSRKTGTKHGVVAPPPRLSYRIRLPERDDAGNLFLGAEHEVGRDGEELHVYPSGGRMFLPTRPQRSDWRPEPPPLTL